ncbi:H-NS histone family protein [Comamonas terrigena]|uniref:H-NS histone family protein n=1 Tax=Comamonas terrigena TaxID=32013 RepID=UPI0028A2D441|nr:H-NS histone family protein [Comamonas terrigena]
MSTYKELLAQRAELEKKIEAERSNARAQALATVRALCAEHGITPADLAPSASKGKPRVTGAVPAKYRDPATGATWTGRGKEPVWIRGQDRDSFRIATAE